MKSTDGASSSFARSVELEIENVDEFRITLTFDGDYPKIEFIVSRLVTFAEERRIDFMIHAASCSLLQQTMDLCKV